MSTPTESPKHQGAASLPSEADVADQEFEKVAEQAEAEAALERDVPTRRSPSHGSGPSADAEPSAGQDDEELDDSLIEDISAPQPEPGD